ncbi:hypothetical protein KP509_06G080300 [Ceratopteris richardii]|uniref:Mitochondrial inner membrane protease subunit 2 n=1 Tax=Ceratopteris richardii TaxID=49495 RepID=A0A8T2UPW1_CERRI|nr:hypothetical protein KP509_06G080300 [Ceratopteris richardii]KAH7435804.1 hypothetical protein KP509_06G080300 [Ceratopteris richardii]KAH7435805.1 hypothetical protein KP509_06G080300 [Ceratopteris richardii]KAH7435807.1 hypothetical protein KP509_06G080300 [Ceratopteris richardii]KAH7435809.1 hypothetical protein KP509_06G080300 [Ceratopteris richardii]
MAEPLWFLAKRSAAAAMICITFTDIVGNFATIQGNSMQPTLQQGHKDFISLLKGDVVFYEKISAPAYKYCRGDVVVLSFFCRSPTDPDQLMVKRLIAMQGDWVNVPGSHEIHQIPKGRCWVEGDNGNLSLDSRNFGPIPLGLVKGRVTIKIPLGLVKGRVTIKVWPPHRIGRVERVLPEGQVMFTDIT